MSSFEGWKGYFCGQMRRLLSTQRDSKRLGLRWLLSGRRFGVTFTMSIVGWTSHKESPSTYGVKFPLATHRIRYRKTIPWWSSQTKAVKSLGSSGDRLPTRQCSNCLNTPTWPLYWEPLRIAYGGQTASKRWVQCIWQEPKVLSDSVSIYPEKGYEQKEVEINWICGHYSGGCGLTQGFRNE